MRADDVGRGDAQPTRTPVAANAFEMPSTKIVYGATPARAAAGVTCRVSPNVSIQ